MGKIRVAVLAALSVSALTLVIWAFAPKAGAVGLSARPGSGYGVWQAVDQKSINHADWKAPAADTYRALRLNKDALAAVLARAPMERTGDLRKSATVLSLPMPDGSFQRFHIEQSPVMDAELVARYPEIKSYRGHGIEDGTATVRFDWTPLGFHALVLSADHPAVNILPPDRTNVTAYVSYYDKGEAIKCGVTEANQLPRKRPTNVTPDTAIGTTLRTERIAIAVTWEFCNTLGGDTVAGSISAINSYLNGANAIYERELSTHMNLVNAPNVIYASNNNVCGPGHNVACNAGNDPYTNSSDSTMLNEVRPDLRDKVGPANYDVGHALGTGGSGIASLAVVCDGSDFGDGMGPAKGSGVSLMQAPAGNSYSVGVWSHELGHQHGAHHSFNANTGPCTPSRDPSAAWEVGSGSTLMAYPQICPGDDVANARDLRFHNGSYNEILTYLATSGACATTSATGNNIPTVNAGTAKTIPKLTPFTLTATGSDADPADIPNLTFAWEQLDAGGALYQNPPYGDQPGDPSSTTRPLFRAFPPLPAKSRTFPSLSYILNNANIPPATIGGYQTGESLPAVSRTINFRCTVRDQRGGVNDSPVAITVDGNSGPFAVTAPNGGGTLSGAQTVTWSVNGTNAAPVSTANVKISLSIDGGNTFPTVLAASVPNTGSAGVTLPNGIATSNARIKIEAVGNIYFDISDANFTLVPADTCPAVSALNPPIGNVGNVVSIVGVNLTGVNAVTFSNNVPAASFTVVNANQINATVPAGASGGPLTLSKPGCANIQTGIFTLCSNPPTALTVDDGSINGANSSGDGAYYVNRLTPVSYPATLSQVSIFWDPFQGFPPGTAIKVVAGANPAGTANINGTTFQTFPATAGAQPGFSTYTLPVPLTIASGDFVVGFQAPIDPSLAVAIDNTTPAGRSYTSNDGTTFTSVVGENYMIRAAQVFSGCSAGSPTLKILSITRSANGHALLQCLGAASQVNNLQVSPDLSPMSFGTVVPAPPAADGTGLFQYDDANAVGLTKRFYRLSFP